MFGYAGALLPGMPLARLLPGIPESNAPDEGLGAPFHQSLSQIAELEGRRSTGETVPVSVQFYEVQAPEGRLIAGHVRDLSQEREVDRLKKRFVASVSHELRTPLTAIRGSLGLLAKGAGGALASEAQDLVNMAERNAVRLGVIINDILDFERIESGLLSLAREQFPLDAAVSSMLDAVSGAAGEAGIRILAEPTGLPVYGDRARIEQVLVNLVSNAIKFSPAGTAVEIQATRHATHVEVRVCDRGRGIPPDQRDTIFGMFRQVEDSDARRHGGSGLGLAICRAIVGQHGGTIRVDAREGGGSIFQFTLPARVGTAVSAR